MENYKYSFKLSRYEIDGLLPQVSKALEKRTELVSRERYPGLWKQTDMLRASSGQGQNRLRTKVLSILCILIGIFLFVPGLVKPQELLVPLLVGAVAVGAGIGGLWRSRKHKKNPFEKSAKLLLAGKDEEPSEPVEVVFSESGMTIPVENGATETVSYDKFECVIETEDSMLFVFEERVTLLQKRDLVGGTPEEFCAFCAEKVRSYQTV